MTDDHIPPESYSSSSKNLRTWIKYICFGHTALVIICKPMYCKSVDYFAYSTSEGMHYFQYVSSENSDFYHHKYILLHPIMDSLTWQATFTLHGQHFFVDILCRHISCRQKPHDATLFCRGTRIQGRRHLVTAAPSLQSCAYRSLRVTIKLDSAAI